ncbi:MAG: hypothetical protein DPW09_45330, partial [Anaerolineae bacterium]|nr:hypothetical protein [Anaerolineae bacterium]
MSLGNRLRLWTLIIIGFIVYLIVQFGVGFYTDYLWFQQLKLESVLLTGLWARVWAGLVVALPVVILFWINIFIARWQSIRNVLFFSDETLVAQRFIVWVIWLAGLVLGWLVAVAAASDWLLLLRFVNRQDFNLADPIFTRDVGFYMFSLPVYHFAQRWLIIALFLSLFGAAAIYAMAQQNNLAEGRVVVLPHVQLHLSVIGVFIFLTFAAGHWLELIDLMYSTRGVAFGASYTDINVSMPALWVMVAVAVIAAVLLLVNIFLRRPALSLLAIFIWI